MQRGASLARAVCGSVLPRHFAKSGFGSYGALGTLPHFLVSPAVGETSRTFTTNTPLEDKAAGIHAQVSFPFDLDKKQIQMGARLRKALVYALQSSSIASKLRPGTGLSIQEVRMSADLRSASVLFTALPGQDVTAARDLERHAVALRQAVSKILGIKHTPALVFCSATSVASDSAAIEDAFRAIAQERQGNHDAYSEFLAQARAKSEEGAGPHRAPDDGDVERDANGAQQQGASEQDVGEASRGRRRRRGGGAITEDDLWKLLASESDDPFGREGRRGGSEDEGGDGEAAGSAAPGRRAAGGRRRRSAGVPKAQEEAPL